MDVFLFNQDFSIVAERNLQDMSATDCLYGQIRKKQEENICVHLTNKTVNVQARAPL